MTTYGYARVSTDAQDYTSQVDALKAAGVAKGDIVADKASGASLEARALSKLISRLLPGDTLVVAKLDRLARSIRDTFNVVHEITAAGAQLRVLDLPMLDTTDPVLGKVVLTALAMTAELERYFIIRRTTDGRARAKARGVRFGRKAALSGAQVEHARALRAGGASFSEIGEVLGVAHTTVSRALG